MRIVEPSDLPRFVQWKDKPQYDRSLNTVCSYVRILNHLGRIIDGLGVTAAAGSEENEDGTFVPHLATYLKLLLVASYARNATFKIGSTKTSKLYYLDILSSSGLSYPRGGADPVPGSCFFVPLAQQDFVRPRKAPEKTFTKVWVFERDAQSLRALKDREQRLRTNAGFSLPKYECIEGDVNETLGPVLRSLSNERALDRQRREMGSLSLAFVDNIGLDVTMKTLGEIQSSIRADLVIHLPVRAIWRSIQQHAKRPGEPRKLDSFFGDRASWEAISGPDKIASAYQSQVQELTGAEFQDFAPVSIRSEKEEFALCIYARRTGGMSPHSKGWVDSIRKLANACNRTTPELLRSVLDVASQRQRTLDTL